MEGLIQIAAVAGIAVGRRGISKQTCDTDDENCGEWGENKIQPKWHSTFLKTTHHTRSIIQVANCIGGNRT